MGKPNDLDILVGHNIRIYRAARSMTQRAVAVGMALNHPTWSPGTVSEVERGRRGVLVGELRDLANVLSTTMAALLSEDVLRRSDPHPIVQTVEGEGDPDTTFGTDDR